MRGRRRGAVLRRARQAARTSRPPTGGALLDWVQSWGPLIFGHADPETVEAVREAALDGTSFGAPTEREVELAAEIVDAVPSVEQVRLVSSGTEAAMSALRLARAFTRRTRVIKFAGCYHGHADPFLAEAGSGLATLGIPASPGRPAAGRRRHDRRRLQRRRPRRGRGRAAQRGPRGDLRRAGRREHGLRSTASGIPRGAARAVRRVRCAARLRRGDHRLPRRARRRAGALRRQTRPDHPRQDRRRRPPARGVRRAAPRSCRRLAPAGDVYQAGTLSGNPLATAAGLSVLRRLRDDPSTRSSSDERRASRPASPRSASSSGSVRCSRSSPSAQIP